MTLPPGPRSALETRVQRPIKAVLEDKIRRRSTASLTDPPSVPEPEPSNEPEDRVVEGGEECGTAGP